MATADVRNEVSSSSSRRRGSIRFSPIAARSSGPGVSMVTRVRSDTSDLAGAGRESAR